MSEGNWVDPIVAEVHRIRREHAERFNHDLTAMFQDWRERQEQSRKEGRTIIPAPPRPDQSAEPAA
ncbi:MAG: hypothetical protein WBC44_12545 [Planctomycetaceae bacterium]